MSGCFLLLRPSDKSSVNDFLNWTILPLLPTTGPQHEPIYRHSTTSFRPVARICRYACIFSCTMPHCHSRSPAGRIYQGYVKPSKPTYTSLPIDFWQTTVTLRGALGDDFRLDIVDHSSDGIMLRENEVLEEALKRDGDDNAEMSGGDELAQEHRSGDRCPLKIRFCPPKFLPKYATSPIPVLNARTRI